MKLRSEFGMEAWGLWQSEFSSAHWITTTTTGRDLATNRWQACKWCRSTDFAAFESRQLRCKTAAESFKEPSKAAQRFCIPLQLEWSCCLASKRLLNSCNLAVQLFCSDFVALYSAASFVRENLGYCSPVNSCSLDVFISEGGQSFVFSLVFSHFARHSALIAFGNIFF